MMFIPESFKLYELLPKIQFQAWWPRHRENLWQAFGFELPWTLQQIRNGYDRRIFINTWWWGGSSELRGWRPMDCPIGALSSTHKFFRGVDFIVEGISSEQIRLDIKCNPDNQMFKYIRRVEEGVSHNHIDFGNHDRETHGIKWVTP